jgi:hypothetical protein
MMKSMTSFLTLLLCFMYTGIDAQIDYSQRVSPPAATRGMLDDATIIISYSQPSVKGRVIWGDLVPYGKVWRTGANEATTLETDKDILIGGKELTQGKYALFTIPGEKEWVVIINKEWDQWGSFKYDASKDVLRITAVPQQSPAFHEQLKFDISDQHIVLSWENLQLNIPLESL